MSEHSVDTQQLHQWLQRMQAGDLKARDELIRGVCGRLEELARRMMRRFPNVRHYAGTDDLLQNALLRLLRALEKLEAPGSMREFYALATQQMRRELLDLARHVASARGPRAALFSQLPQEDSSGFDAEAPAEEGAEQLEWWGRFHHQVESLPVEEREVVGLVFYHGWKHGEVAELFQVSERTVRRWLQSARRRLGEQLGMKEAILAALPDAD
jgi:RNA polymerase sigma-70 factor (ECF subfamily)